jgi:hypothetical protein
MLLRILCICRSDYLFPISHPSLLHLPLHKLQGSRLNTQIRQGSPDGSLHLSEELLWGVPNVSTLPKEV